MNIVNFEMFDLFEEANHDVECKKCGKHFEIRTEVEFTFISPVPGERESD